MGPYKNWFGPYQFVEKFFWFLKEETRDKIADKLPLKPFEFIDRLKGDRKIEVHIDDYDVWGMDTTLSHIIVTMLFRLKENKHGAPYVDDEDVPDNLKSTSAPPKENEWDTDANHFDRWDWVLDEMIWAFEQNKSDWEQQFYSGEHDYEWKDVGDGIGVEMIIGPKDTFKIDHEGMKKHHDRMKNGYRLFGKYYENLWD
jgi:hypothetical protein